MRFISKHAAHIITVESGSARAIVSPSGATTFHPNNDDFHVRFLLRTLTPAEIDAAKEQLLIHEGGNAFGSTPKRDGGILDTEEGLAAGYGSLHHDGYDVYQNLSVYDTEDPLQCPPEWRERTEEFLLNHYELNRSYVRVDNWNLTPPWPTYSSDPNVNVDAMVKFAKAGGFLVPALHYERNEGRRPNLIAAYEAALEAEQAESALSAELSAQV